MNRKLKGRVEDFRKKVDEFLKKGEGSWEDWINLLKKEESGATYQKMYEEAGGDRELEKLKDVERDEDPRTIGVERICCNKRPE